jgi:hypothetical protein
MLHPARDMHSDEPGGTSKSSSFHRALWGLAVPVIGIAVGSRLTVPDTVDPGYYGLPAQTLGAFVDQSFSRILDEAFRSNRVFEHPDVPDDLLLLVASESCGPSREALLLLASMDHGRPVLVAHQGGSDEWIRELSGGMNPAPQELSDLIFSALPRVGTPTLIAVSQRTVVSFGMGSLWVSAHYGSPE